MKNNNQTLLAKKLIENYTRINQQNEQSPRCFIGFDGFTDEIVEAVATRLGPDTYSPMTTIEELGRRILDSAGKSCNIELIVRDKKIGGNAPILTNALLEGGHRITFAGAIGTSNEIEPLFLPMASRCEKVYPLCPSGHSDALEFQDGKVILGKHASVIHIDYRSIIKHIGKENLIKHLEETDLFVSANWTMLPMMTALWRELAEEIVPRFSTQTANKQRWLFVDLADPAKRTDKDISEGLAALKKLGKGFDVILGLNEAEAIRIANVLGLKRYGGDSAAIMALAEDIYDHSGLYQIVVHATKFAVGVNGAESALVPGPYAENPVLTTGAGDNFNAGFCNALLYKLSLEEALLSGVYTSGFYVRTGRSPTLSELAAFLES